MKDEYEPIVRLSNEKDDIVYERFVLCDSILGLPVPLISITASPNKKHPIKKRKVIVISSWIHPGESVASFVFNGFLKFILSPDARHLRKLFIFKLIPVQNPDGVVLGNYRSSIAGVDLNRMWISPDKTIHPTVFALK